MDSISNSARERVEIHLSAKATVPGAAALSKPSAGTEMKDCENWRELLAKAACEVFEVMVGTSLVKARDHGLTVIADYTAMVGIAGGLCGVLSIRGSSESARRIAANMLGVDDVNSGSSVLDAFGEVCNMIAGSFKSRIGGSGDSCALSVPTVISGKDYSLYSLANEERIEVIFTFEGRPLSVTLDLHS